MNAGTESSASAARSFSVGARILVTAAVACLVAAGLLLWSARGDAVFSDIVLAALRLVLLNGSIDAHL